MIAASRLLVVAGIASAVLGGFADPVETEFYPASPRWDRINIGPNPGKPARMERDDLAIVTFMLVPTSLDETWAYATKATHVGPEYGDPRPTGPLKVKVTGVSTTFAEYGGVSRALALPCFPDEHSEIHDGTTRDLIVLRIPRPDGVLALCLDPRGRGR